MGFGMSDSLPSIVRERFAALRAGNGNLVVMTGAGISAESGIPTFRGEEGYWVVGSREYQPEEMATHAMFSRQPDAVWSWYLYRRGVCHRATPNAGHGAVAELEHSLADRFRLLTQNVDGLHIRAGNSLERTYQIHGNIDYARCDRDCGQPIWPLGESLGIARARGDQLTDAERRQLCCPGCAGRARPHVLWFDEYYDETNYRYSSSIQAAETADVLLVVGTSGATNLPMQVGQEALRTGAFIVDVNPEPNPFSRLAESSGGVFLRGSSGAILPAIAELLHEA